MSAFEKVAVAAAEGQLFVEVWLTQDAGFERDLAEYEKAATERSPGANQPATVRMGEWWVEAVTSDGFELSVMRQSSGGSGTEGLMQWILWPLHPHPVDISVTHRGKQVWSTTGFTPSLDENRRPLSEKSLRSSQPMSYRGPRP